VQVPPNLAPAREVVDCGIDDLGGVSPVTDDHINPDYAWPALETLREIADYAGVPLRERLPVYERYLPADLRSEHFDGDPAGDPVDAPSGARTSDADGWLADPIRVALTAANDAGRRYRAVIEDGAPPA
jgi:FO synthase subunit 1